MNSYEYKPPKDRLIIAVVFALLLLSIVVFAAGSALREYAGLMELSGVVLAAGGLLIGTRYLMTEYVYAVEMTDSATDGYDLVITECRGKVRRVVCRVSVSGGKLQKITPDTPKPKCTIFNYCQSPRQSDACYFFPDEKEGGGAVKFSPDATLIRLLGGEKNADING
ncbi:MAG: hypothetical protein MJ102_06765 [Clostridia bacterium]|nr:hypothetical protein [Clostridia bacterium]